MPKKPISCPVCGEPLVTMFRVVAPFNLDGGKRYVPVHVCGACKIGVRTHRLSMDKTVAHKPKRRGRWA